MNGVIQRSCRDQVLKAQMEKGKTKVFMGQSTYVRYGQYTYLLEAAGRYPLKGMPWLEITPA